MARRICERFHFRDGAPTARQLAPAPLHRRDVCFKFNLLSHMRARAAGAPPSRGYFEGNHRRQCSSQLQVHLLPLVHAAQQGRALSCFWLIKLREANAQANCRAALLRKSAAGISTPTILHVLSHAFLVIYCQLCDQSVEPKWNQSSNTHSLGLECRYSVYSEVASQDSGLSTQE